MARQVPLPFRRREAPEPVVMPPIDSPLYPRASVLNTVELLENIFVNCSQPDLILRIQRVCRLWHAIAITIPQTFLNTRVPPFDPNPDTSLHDRLYKSFRAQQRFPSWGTVPETQPLARNLNPLLEYHFGALFTPNQKSGSIFLDLARGCSESLYARGSWYEVAQPLETKLAQMTIARNESTSKVHRAFARPSASWRRMQLCTPPITSLMYVRGPYHLDGPVQTVAFPDGLRMGDLYDLVIEGIVCKLTSATHGRVKLVWWREGIMKGVYRDFRENDNLFDAYQFPEGEDSEHVPKGDPRCNFLYVFRGSGTRPATREKKKNNVRLESALAVLRRKLMMGREPVGDYIVKV